MLGRAAPAAAIAALAALLMTAMGAPARTASGHARPRITFSHPSIVDPQRLAAEPRILVDHQNNVWVTGPIGTQYATSFLWKSEDGAASFDLLRAFPPLQRPNPHTATGDNELVILPPAAGHKVDAVVWSDMIALAGLQNVATFDGGNTFPPEYWNDFASQPGADRQWLAAMPIPGHKVWRIYQWYDDYGVHGLSVIYTDDYGQHWVDGQRDMGANNPGNIAADPVHQKVWITWGAGAKVMVGSAGANAKGFKPKAVATGHGEVANLFTVIAVDTDGNPYVVWTNQNGDRAVYLTRSTDLGQTWSTVRVSPPSLHATAFPWIVAGDPGRVWVTYYGTRTDRAVPENRGPWNAFASQSLNALGGSASWRTVRVSEHPNHDNEICLSGIACTAGEGEDRNMLDDFTSAIDRRGMLHIAFNDTNNQIGQSDDPDAGGAFDMVTRQLSGPSLYRRVGVVVPRPKPPKVLVTERIARHLYAGVAAKLPPGNWSVDLRGDARDPRHGQSGPGPRRPAADLRRAWLSRRKGGSLVAHLRLTRLPRSPQEAATAAGRDLLYMVLFMVHGKVFFGALDAAAGQAYAGTPGFVPNQAGVAKMATYRPDPDRTQTTSFTWKGGKRGRIAIRLPVGAIGALKKGTRLDAVTAFVQAEQGGGNQQLLDELDAAPATSWRVGSARRYGGAVQGSVDDASFAHVIRAHRVGRTGKRWQLAVSFDGLAAGRHTLYVRRVVAGFGSKPVAVPFTVPR